MKDKKVLPLFGFICLALVLAVLPFMAACGQPAAPKEPVYTVLDPRSWEPEVDFQGLTPRLDTLKGKKVGVINMGGAGSEIMETIGPDLEVAVPGCSTVYRQVGHGPGAMMGAWDLMQSCDAIILGHNY